MKTSKTFKIIAKVPLFAEKGYMFKIYDQTGAVTTWFDDSKVEFSVRAEVAQYLRLISKDPKYVKLIKQE